MGIMHVCHSRDVDPATGLPTKTLCGKPFCEIENSDGEEVSVTLWVPSWDSFRYQTIEIWQAGGDVFCPACAASEEFKEFVLQYELTR